MNVQELFTQIGFDAIMDALRNTHRNEPSIQHPAEYKQAFDNLSTLAFSGEGGEVTFDVTPREEWFTPHSLPMLARGVEGDYWNNIVGKEVVRPEDNPFTDAELAGAILWGATFYGFTSHNQWHPREEIYSEYGRRARELELRQYRPYIRDKKILKQLKKDDFPYGNIAFPMEIWDKIQIREIHQNRHKRKRIYRLEKRIEQLKNLDKRVKKIDEIQHDTGKNIGDLKNRIMQAGSIIPDWRECHLHDGENRVDYATDLMTNYFPTASDILGIGEESIVIFYTLPENKLTLEERNKLEDFLTSASGSTKVNFYDGVNPEQDFPLGIEFVGISKNKIEDDD